MAKIKVGLYLVNKGYQNIDLSLPEEGNPGIGGTQYNFITLPHYFVKYFSEVDFVLFANINEKLPSSFETIQAKNLTEAARKAKSVNCDIFIYRPSVDEENFVFLNELKRIKIKTIAWIHNTPFKMLRRLARHPYIVRYVNVSKEQYDMLRDHPIIYKADVICNGFDPTQYIPNTEIVKEKSVVYIGSLIPAKGFHVLARVWKSIISEVPDAKLRVIGSGKLYNRNSKLGDLGIADEQYEKIFKPYLTNENGDILSSVFFHGLLGKEKISIMQNALVGCVNPTGVTENCPGSAIEMQACGTPVVSGAYWGLLDTVENNVTGLLGKTDNDLVENIVLLLKDQKLNERLGKSGVRFVQEKFDHKKISNKWNELFHNILLGESTRILEIDQNPSYEFKQFSEKMRLLKRRYKILNFIPPYIELRPFHHKLNKIFNL